MPRYTYIYLCILWYALICIDMLWYMPIYYATFWYATRCDDTLWYSMLFCDMLWYTRIYYEYITIYYDRLRYVMIYYDIPTIYYNILWFTNIYYDILRYAAIYAVLWSMYYIAYYEKLWYTMMCYNMGLKGLTHLQNVDLFDWMIFRRSRIIHTLGSRAGQTLNSNKIDRKHQECASNQKLIKHMCYHQICNTAIWAMKQTH